MSTTARIVVGHGEDPGEVEPPGGEGELLFTSDWSFATGNSVNALLDNGKWSGFSGCPTYNPPIINVIDGDSVGWTETENVYETYHNAQDCGAVLLEPVPGLSDGDSYRIRWYRRVGGTGTSGLVTWHGDAMQVGYFAEIEATLWAIHNPSSTEYDMMLGIADDAHYCRLQRGVWYRMEFGIQIVNHALRRFRIWPFIYSYPAGVLLFDASDFVGDFGGGSTLQSKYDLNIYDTWEGGTYEDLAWRQFGLGNEGSSSAGPSGQSWQTAAVEIRKGWDLEVGPI